MTNLGGFKQIFHGDTTVVDTTQSADLGTKAVDQDGNEYIYLQGVAAVVNGSVVSFDEAGVTTLLAAGAVGRVAVAKAAIIANTFGWFQVYGTNTEVSTGTVVGDLPCYIDATPGRVAEAAVAGDWVSGAITRSADTANVATVELSYPAVCAGGYLV